MRRALPVIAIVSLALTGCYPSATDHTFRPRLEWTACPPDVEASFVSRHECGYLTVLQDRTNPRGRTVRLLLVKAWPVGVEPGPGIGSGFGGNIGDPRGLTGNIATGATRAGRIVVEIESRGAGPHVQPRLTCPEVDQLATRAAAARSDDPALLRDFETAVKACHDRLAVSGVDVADYDVAERAADLEDLRVALGADHLHIGAEGTASRFAFEYLRRFPGHVATAYLDSPWFPDVDDLTGGIAGTRAALAELFTACAAENGCEQTFPRLESTWRAALDRLNTTPLRGPGILVDAAKLLRIVRFALGGDGPDNLRLLPRIITDAARGVLSPDLARLVAADPVFCAGYRPLCTGQDGFGLGVYLTVLCRDQLPFVDSAALSAAANGEPAYQTVFVNSPYRTACAAWDVPAADPATHESIRTGVPLLLLTGQFDSFSAPAWAQTRAGRLEHAWAVTVAGQTHNVLGFSECAIATRNAWRQAPMSPPSSDVCSGHVGFLTEG